MKLASETFDIKEFFGALFAIALVVTAIAVITPHLKPTPNQVAYAKIHGVTNNDQIAPFPTVKASVLHPIDFLKEVMAPFPTK